MCITTQCKDDEEKAEDGWHELHGYEAPGGGYGELDGCGRA